MARSFTITQEDSSRTFTVETGVGPVGPAGESGASTWADLTGEANHVPFDTTPTSVPTTEGTISWNSDDHTLNIQTDLPDVVQQVGQETMVRVRNVSGATIANGSAVYLSGASGQRATIEKASAANAAHVSSTIGLVTSDISNNGNGYVTTQGLVRGINTSAFAEGATLYLSDSVAGSITDTAPTTKDVVRIGWCVVSGNNGSILVSVQRMVTNVAVNAAIAEDPDASRAALGIGENWIFEGDSWTAGTAQGNDRETWPYYLSRFSEVVGRVTCTNVATAGQTAATMVSTFSAQVAPHCTDTTGVPSTVFIFAGINDTAGTTTQLRDNLRLLWTAARDAGARVVAFTLPHRTAAGGWSQADWLTINTQIIADSSYYDVLIRMDILCSNASNTADFTDNLHVNTAAHSRVARKIFEILNGATAYPISPPDLVCNASSGTLAAGTRRNLPFTESYDANADGTTATVGSDASTAIFTAPVDGTYEFSSTICVGSVASGDTVYLNAWVTPLATGTEVEHRLDYQVAAGANLTVKGGKRIRMLRGDKINIAIVSSKASTAILPNANNAEFVARLVSIP